MTPKDTYEKAFTLIEVLVVLGILGIMMAVGLTSFIGSQRSARNARRVTDLEKIRSALEQYKGDVGTYPAATAGSTETGLKSPLVSPTSYFTTTTFPKDPRSPSSYYYYQRDPAGVGNNNTYRVCAYLETPFPSGFGCPAGTSTASCGSANCNYGLSQP